MVNRKNTDMSTVIPECFLRESYLYNRFPLRASGNDIYLTKFFLFEPKERYV